MRRIGVIAGSIALVVVVTSVVMACAQKKSGPGMASTSRSTTHAYSALANGQSIFQTGRDLDGVQIAAQTPPLESRCEACHRADGSGGRHFPNGIVSADLRHRALVIEQKHPYTLALLGRAISTGVDNEGKPLDRVMPRRRMSKRDLHDLAEYVLLKLK